MAKMEVNEMLDFACESFKKKDYAVSKDFCLRAISKDPQNIQAKELYNFIILHKQINGRYDKLNIYQVAGYLAKLSEEENLNDRSLAIELADFEIPENIKDLDYKLIEGRYLTNLNENLIKIRESKNAEKLYNQANRLAYLSTLIQKQVKEKEEYETELETKYGTPSKSKKSWKEKLGIAWIIALPFIILLLPGYIIYKVIMSVMGKK